ncbi:MAG: hypothetical protein H7832_11880 [Magnetococcus sp. DMHC-6]
MSKKKSKSKDFSFPSSHPKNIVMELMAQEGILAASEAVSMLDEVFTLSELQALVAEIGEIGVFVGEKEEEVWLWLGR